MFKLAPWMLVALGGALGAVARWSVYEALGPRNVDWPVGTFLINVTGCFLIAAFAGAAQSHAGLQDGWRLLFPVGFVGAYTTFSTYALELVRLTQRGSVLGALTYLVASNVLGLAAAVVGLWVGARL